MLGWEADTSGLQPDHIHRREETARHSRGEQYECAIHLCVCEQLAVRLHCIFEPQLTPN